jgi:hypothetical protein
MGLWGIQGNKKTRLGLWKTTVPAMPHKGVGVGGFALTERLRWGATGLRGIQGGGGLVEEHPALTCEWPPAIFNRFLLRLDHTPVPGHWWQNEVDRAEEGHAPGVPTSFCVFSGGMTAKRGDHGRAPRQFTWHSACMSARHFRRQVV